MNTARASRVGEDRIQLLQLAGSLDGVVVVVGEYPQTWVGDNRFDQFVIHVLADPQAAGGQLPADQYQFVMEGPSEEDYWIVECFQKEHSLRKRYSGCTHRCRHRPLPSLYPNLNWTFAKGSYSYDQRRAQFGHTSDLDVAVPMPGYETALHRLKVVVGEAVSHGLDNLRIIISATNPQTLPSHRFSDQRAREQQALVNRCIQVCEELAGHVDLELRNVDSLRNFVGPTSSRRNCTFQDHSIPEW